MKGHRIAATTVSGGGLPGAAPALRASGRGPAAPTAENTPRPIAKGLG